MGLINTVKAKENPIRNTLGCTLWWPLSIESNKNTLKTHGLLSNNSRITSQSAESYWAWMLMRQSNSRHVSNRHWFLCPCGVKTVLSTIIAELTIDPPAALDQSEKQASGATGPWMKSIFESISDTCKSGQIKSQCFEGVHVCFWHSCSFGGLCIYAFLKGSKK